MSEQEDQGFVDVTIATTPKLTSSTTTTTMLSSLSSSSLSTSCPLLSIARKSYKDYPNSDIELALSFCTNAGDEQLKTKFRMESNDRLVKLARRIKGIIKLIDATSNDDEDANKDSNSPVDTTSTNAEKKEDTDTIETTTSTTATSGGDDDAPVLDGNNDNDNNSPLVSDENIIEASIQDLIDECNIITSGTISVPKVRFGKTNLDISVVTLGCMRFQQEWGPRITNQNMIDSDCQDNLVAILKTAILDYGMNHIETARGYGCSEIQLGTALKQLFMTGQIQRTDLIIQTKIPPMESMEAFRMAVETSFRNLQIDYIDLFAFHGMNYDEQLEWTFGTGSKAKKQQGDDATAESATAESATAENCMSVIKEYMDAGKIRHVGFSTHGSTEYIERCINYDVFEYINIHYHYFGSYTASGCNNTADNLNPVKLAQSKDMGIFIISPFDKGGMLYEPSNKIVSLTMPEFQPMSFMSQWIWNHHKIYANDNLPQLHTYTLGAARPSDLDQAAVDAYRMTMKPDDILSKVKNVTKRLDITKEQALGKQWLDTWYVGLLNAKESKYFVEHNQIIWLYNVIKAFGMYEFAKARYKSFENNGLKWDDKLTPEDNIDKKIGKNPWGWVPGLQLKDPSKFDYSEDLVNVPIENLRRIIEAEIFVYKYCRDRTLDDKFRHIKQLVQLQQTAAVIMKQATNVTMAATTATTNATLTALNATRTFAKRATTNVTTHGARFSRFINRTLTTTTSPGGDADAQPFDDEDDVVVGDVSNKKEQDDGGGNKKGEEKEMVGDDEAKESSTTSTPLDDNSEKSSKKDDDDHHHILVIPNGWKSAYVMKPWTDFPDRVKRV